VTDKSLTPLSDVEAVRKAFDKAAPHYDEYAVLQRNVADHLLDTLTLFTISPEIVVDLGTGTGYCAPPLAKRFPKAKLMLCDISHTMLKQAQKRPARLFNRRSYVCADINHLPFAEASVDLLFSSLSFQWCSNLDLLFSECNRVLKPDGLLLFSSLGPDTLKELRTAFSTQGNTAYVHDFVDMHDVGDALIRAGFSAPVLETDRLVMTYPTMKAVMQDLRGIGAVNQSTKRRRGLSTRKLFQLAEEAYETYRHNDTLPATYEVVYAHAFSPTRTDPLQDGSRVATFPFDKLARRSTSGQ
jgi:malonyl-CoA O-methyltransferase